MKPRLFIGLHQPGICIALRWVGWGFKSKASGGCSTSIPVPFHCYLKKGRSPAEARAPGLGRECLQCCCWRRPGLIRQQSAATLLTPASARLLLLGCWLFARMVCPQLVTYQSAQRPHRAAQVCFSIELFAIQNLLGVLNLSNFKLVELEQPNLLAVYFYLIFSRFASE